MSETKQPKVEEDFNDEDDAAIDMLQAQIEQNAKDRAEGKTDGWTFDPDAWRDMPAFMDEITEKDVEENPQVAALQSMAYEGKSAEEIAEDCKAKGNEIMARALKADAINPATQARAARAAYDDGLLQGSTDSKINSQLYCNRSMANYLMENFGRGLKDAQRAILIDDKYVKAYNRGAKCALKIRKWAIAKSLIASGLALVVTKGEDGKEKVTDESVKRDFDNLTEQLKKGEEADAAAVKKEKLKNRAAAAKSNNLLKDLTSKGIKISPRAEVSSEQWAQTGNKKPYFDEEGVLHIPLLLMYDEAQMTDFLQDVPCDVTMAEVLEQEIMPFPWDSTGRYATLDHFVCVFIVDDGVKMPEYHKMPMDWTLFEVLRQPEYVMPGLVPTFHIVAKGSDYLKQWKIDV